MEYKRKLWLWLGAIFIISFGILGLIGREIYVKAPPVPADQAENAETDDEDRPEPEPELPIIFHDRLPPEGAELIMRR